MGLEHFSEVVDALKDPKTGDNIQKTGAGIRDAIGGTAKDVGSVFTDILEKYKEIKETASGKDKLLLEQEIRIIEQVAKLSPEAQLALVEKGFFDKVLENSKDERDSSRAHDLTLAAERKQFLKQSLQVIGGGGLISLLSQQVRASSPTNGKFTEKLQANHTARATENQAMAERLQDKPYAFLVTQVGETRAYSMLSKSEIPTGTILGAISDANHIGRNVGGISL